MPAFTACSPGAGPEEGEHDLATVGIIANPAASTDIRRLVAHGRMVPAPEKVNIIRRVMFGLEGAGVTRVLALPDLSHLCQRARDDAGLSLDLELLEMPLWGGSEDSTRAAGLMREMGVGCVVTLGGDGTNRAVAKGCGDVPLVPVSTGTNNVFPMMIEGTLAGLAAAVVARGVVGGDGVIVPSKRVEVYVDGEFRDIALVDMAVSTERFVGSRAIWDMSTVHEVVLARAEPASIGLSSIGARLHPLSMTDPGGLYFRPGRAQDGKGGVMAPVAPGMVRRVPVAEWRVLSLGERVAIGHSPCTISLDGEREFAVLPGQKAEAAVTGQGPRVVMLEEALREADRLGVFAVSG